MEETTKQFKTLTHQEQTLDMKSLSLKFLIQKENEKMSRIRHIQTNMAAPQNLQLAINLLSNKRFCSKLHCYQNHKFNIEANGKVKIDTIVTNLKLKPHVHTSCQLLKTGRKSIFHNENV